MFRNKYENELTCPRCSGNVLCVAPTWWKNGYHECLSCGHRLSIKEVASQMHYLRNIKPMDDKMKTEEYWERRKKLEQQFFVQLEELRKDLNGQFSEIAEFEDITLKYFERHFSEYYVVSQN